MRPGTAADALRVAELHAGQIPDGFLSSLGTSFLRRLYARVSRSSDAFVLVAERRSEVTGFVAVAASTGALYREFLVRDGLAAALTTAPAVLRAPRRTWETLRYGAGGGADGAPRAEVLAVAVDPADRGAGTGSALLGAATAELGRRGIDSVKVITASSNVAAIRLYERCGFRRHATTEVHAGVTQEVMVWRSS